MVCPLTGFIFPSLKPELILALWQFLGIVKTHTYICTHIHTSFDLTMVLYSDTILQTEDGAEYHLGKKQYVSFY